MKVRKEFGLHGKVFLNVGQFIPRKGLDRLIKAWAKIDGHQRKHSFLLLLGGGTEEKALRQLTSILNLSNVIFVPPQPIERLPQFHASTDFFVFPTLEDAWGLVVNEAMACGKPVLCSKYAGCAIELVNEGKNGYFFDPINIEETKDILEKAMNEETESMKRLGVNSREIISEFTYSRMVEGFEKAILLYGNNTK